MNVTEKEMMRFGKNSIDSDIEKSVKKLTTRNYEEIARLIGKWRSLDPDRLFDQVREMLSDENDHYWFGGFSNDKIVSFADAKIRAPKIADFARLYTLPEYRKEGFGEAVATTCIDKLLGEVKNSYRMVEKDNTAARNLYEKIGFEKYKEFEMLKLHTNVLFNP